MITASPETLAETLDDALRAVVLASSEPERARRLVAAVLERAGGAAEPVTVAQRALGVAFIQLGRLAVAEQHLRGSIATAEAGALPVRAAEARASIAYLLALTGRSDEALAATELAAAVLHGPPAAKVAMLRALVLTELGRWADAVAGYQRALDLLAAAGGDGVMEADIRTNRSVAHVRLRDWRSAEADLDRAQELYQAAGHTGRTAMVFHNRANAARVRGDLPAALAAFDEAGERYRAAGREPGDLPLERAEALLSVLLVQEAREVAERVVQRFTLERNAVDLVQARLLLARAALLGHDLPVAADQADRARRSAQRQHRPGWAALAGYLALRARWEGGRRDRAMLRAGRRAATALAQNGWAVEALDARLIAARTAIEIEDAASARHELSHPSLVPDQGPAELRARAHHAQALLRVAEGDLAGAEHALLEGISVLDRFRASLGATELRVHAAGHAGELAGTGVELGLAGNDAEAVFRWTERWRAGALMLRAARPAADPELARALAELRQVVVDLNSGADPARSRARQAALEEEVRRRSLRAAGTVLDDTPTPSPDELHAALGGAALIAYLAVGGLLLAVVLHDGQATLMRLGPLAGVEADLEALRHGMIRQVHRSFVGSLSDSGSDSVAGSVAEAGQAMVARRAGRLDGALLRPLLPLIADRPVVIVPTGALHALPWAALPSAAGRPLAVSPSAALWYRATTAPDPAGGGKVFVAGPRLPFAAPEITALAARYPGAQRFTGRSARVDAVTAALDGAQLAHIAAHGNFRPDNPLFSSLELVDGPLTVYDLERLGRPPRDVVLSACESGLSAVHPGDELLGLAAALLSMGSRSLVASVIPVPDEASRTLMLALHRHLRTGLTPAGALARAQQDLATQTGTTDPGALADPAAVAARTTAQAFQSFGTL